MPCQTPHETWLTRDRPTAIADGDADEEPGCSEAHEAEAIVSRVETGEEGKPVFPR